MSTFTRVGGQAAPAAPAPAPEQEAEVEGRPVARSLSPTARKLFLAWTGVWWGGVGLSGALFFFHLETSYRSP